MTSQLGHTARTRRKGVEQAAAAAIRHRPSRSRSYVPSASSNNQAGGEFCCNPTAFHYSPSTNGATVRGDKVQWEMISQRQIPPNARLGQWDNAHSIFKL